MLSKPLCPVGSLRYLIKSAVVVQDNSCVMQFQKQSQCDIWWVWVCRSHHKAIISNLVQTGAFANERVRTELVQITMIFHNLHLNLRTVFLFSLQN